VGRLGRYLAALLACACTPIVLAATLESRVTEFACQEASLGNGYLSCTGTLWVTVSGLPDEADTAIVSCDVIVSYRSRLDGHAPGKVNDTVRNTVHLAHGLGSSYFGFQVRVGPVLSESSKTVSAGLESVRCRGVYED